ncbi:MAG: hypothetical protein U0350_28680 [Caldilineaceae bacterium]
MLCDNDFAIAACGGLGYCLLGERYRRKLDGGQSGQHLCHRWALVDEMQPASGGAVNVTWKVEAVRVPVEQVEAEPHD